MNQLRYYVRRIVESIPWSLHWTLSGIRDASIYFIRRLHRETFIDIRRLYIKDNKYRYTPLKPGEIRVLKLFPGPDTDPVSCHLMSVPIDKCGHPESLSYTWGTDLPTETILVDGKELQVTPNLHDALLQLRRDLPMPLPSDPGIALGILLERFGAIANVKGTTSFSKDGVKAIYSCFGEWIGEFITLCATRPGFDAQRQPGESEKEYAARLLVYEDVDSTALEVLAKRRLALVQTLMNEHITEEGRKRLAMVPRTLWIDALCINQLDHSERACQLNLMRRIYKRSARLLIWLGKAQHESHKAIDFISQTREKIETQGLEVAVKWVRSMTDRSEFMPTWVALGTFFGRPWFRRSWIVQEYVVGSKDRAVWMCGPQRMSHGVMESFVGMGNALKFRGALTTYGDEFKAMFYQTDPAHLGLEAFGEYDPESPETRRTSADKIFERLSSDFIRGFRAFASLKGLKQTFQIATQNGVIANDCYINFWLGMIRLTESSDPRDKIYSILGLLEVGLKHNGDSVRLDKSSLILNYDASVEDVYASLVQTIVSNTEQLGILSACTNRGEAVHRTWVPDWSKQTHIPLLASPMISTRLGSEFGPAKLQYDFDASRGMDAIATFSADLQTMTVRGFVWNTIDAVASKLVEGSSDFISPGFETDLNQMLKLLREHHGDDMDIYKTLLTALLKEDVQKISTESKSSFDSWIRQIEERAGSPASTTIASSKWRHAPFLTSILDSLWLNRRLVSTTAGNYGQAPETARLDDLVCIILGCPIPMVLRAIDGHYEVIGEAYFPGIMFGEALSALDNDVGILQDFELW